ncbi:hypothetical protein GOV12_04040 [Candidatus Pacearchaeota archaeon]|nr:hypothetical protein [Candidatus Pacearchaeota archaeon]
MKILIIYYSRTGTTRILAEEMAFLLKAETEEIIDKKNRMGAMGWLGSGKDATFNRLTRIIDLKKNLIDYDLIIVGGPVWNSAITPAIRTFLSQNKQVFIGKGLCYFCTHATSSVGKTYSQMEDVTGAKPMATYDTSTKDVKNEKFRVSLNEFVDSLRERMK